MIRLQRILFSVAAGFWLVAGALAVVTLNALLSVTDQLGVLDVVSLRTNGALLVLLIINLRNRGRAHDFSR